MTVAIFLLNASVARARIPGVSVLVGLVLALFTIGFTGTVRIWFIRNYRQEPFGTGEAWRLTWSFLGRFFVLGLIFFLPLGVLVGIGSAIWVGTHSDAFHRNPVTGTVAVPHSFVVVLLVAVLVATLVLDMRLSR